MKGNGSTAGRSPELRAGSAAAWGATLPPGPPSRSQQCWFIFHLQPHLCYAKSTFFLRPFPMQKSVLFFFFFSRNHPHAKIAFFFFFFSCDHPHAKSTVTFFIIIIIICFCSHPMQKAPFTAVPLQTPQGWIRPLGAVQGCSLRQFSPRDRDHLGALRAPPAPGLCALLCPTCCRPGATRALPFPWGNFPCFPRG